MVVVGVSMATTLWFVVVVMVVVVVMSVIVVDRVPFIVRVQ
jgi:hypothetical protein